MLIGTESLLIRTGNRIAPNGMRREFQTDQIWWLLAVLISPFATGVPSNIVSFCRDNDREENQQERYAEAKHGVIGAMRDDG